MKEAILRTLRKTSLDDSEKLQEIFKIASEDTSSHYWINGLVKLSHEEYNKIKSLYWEAVLLDFIVRLDKYIYEKWKQYKSHYMTINKWISGDPKIKKIPQTYRCAYGEIHRKWEDCTCN